MVILYIFAFPIDNHGLFLHGFKSNSLAERQGLLHVGDEFVAVNGVLVLGKYLEDVIDALADHIDDEVLIVYICLCVHMTCTRCVHGQGDPVTLVSYFNYIYTYE